VLPTGAGAEVGGEPTTAVDANAGAGTGVVGVLQMVSEPTLTVSRARMGQLRWIRWRTGQGRGYVCMTRGFSGRDMV
jgi:hypothetical protein